MLKRLLAAAALLLALATPALAQQVAAHAIPLGRGAGVSGFNAIAPAANTKVVAGGGTSSDFAAVTVSGDCSMVSGAFTCTKTNGSSFATVATSGSASDLGTGTLPNARLDAEVQCIAGLTSAADKVAYYTGSGTCALADFSSALRTLITTASSANLRAMLTDESGTGLAYFQGGDAGTPSALVGTNITGTAAGLTAGNVTTNANLTGPITSVGNATTVADAELAALAGLTSASDKAPYFTGSGTAALTDLVANARTLIGHTFSQMRTDLALVIGTNVEAWDADLDTIAGLTATTNNFMVGVSSAWASRTPAQVRTTLALTVGTDVEAWDTDLDSWAAITRASGFDTFVATPSSANLRALLTDEVGTGAAYFVGGALGTPASGTATNLTGLPISGITGLGTGVGTALAVNVGSAGAPVVLNGAGGTPSSLTLTNATGLPLTGLASQAADTVVLNASGSSAAPTAVAMPTSGTNGCAGTTNALTYNTTTHALGCNSIAGAGTGTVTNTGGNLTSNAVVLGAGTVDTKVVAGIVTDGTSKLTLGVAGSSVGAVDFKNATSGTVTLSPVAGALGSVTLSLPAATDTLVGKATTDTLTNKTLTSPTLTTPILGTPTSGTLTNATGYTVANLVGDTSTALGVGSIELGNASDTTIARSAAGIISIEGLPLYSGIPQNSKSAAYTLVLADAQEQIYHPVGDNNARIWTIPANGSVAYPIGTVLTFINEINTITISITTDTMVLCGTGSTGSRTLAVNGMATAVKVTSTRWYICGQGLT